MDRKRKNRQTDRQIGEQRDIHTDGLADEQGNRLTEERHTDRWIDKWIEKQADRWQDMMREKDRNTDRWIDR